MTLKTKRYISDITLLFVALIWGGGFIAVKNGLDTTAPMVLAATRFMIAACLFGVLFHKKLKGITKQEFFKGGVVGFFLYAAFAFQTVALQYTTASKQGFLTATYVVLVPLIHWGIKRELPKAKVFVGSIMTFVGIGLVGYSGELTMNIGDLLTLVCAFLFALHIISIDYFGKEMSSVKLAFIQIAVAAFFFVISAIVSGPFPVLLSKEAWKSVIYLAIFSTCVCFTLQTVAQKYTLASHASMILSLESIFAAIFGILLLDEVMTAKMIIGCILIFAAILMVEMNFKIRRVKPKSIENTTYSRGV